MRASRRRRGPALGALLIALLIGGLSTACSRSPDPQPTAEVRLADYGLSLRFPEHWQLRENEASLRLLARPLQDGRPVPGVWFIVARDRARDAPAGLVAAPPELSTYVERREALARKDVLDYQVIGSGGLRLDGIEAAWRHRRYASYTSRFEAYSAMAVRGRYGYELTGAAPSAGYAAWEPSFTAIVRSLRWLPEPPESAPVP